MDSFMREYRSSFDKTQFLNDKRKQRAIISGVRLDVFLSFDDLSN